jgi:hypothetical protein
VLPRTFRAPVPPFCNPNRAPGNHRVPHSPSRALRGGRNDTRTSPHEVPKSARYRQMLAWLSFLQTCRLFEHNVDAYSGGVESPRWHILVVA